jgi:hypothetical protein
VAKETPAFGAFKRELLEFFARLQQQRIQQVMMESTGIYWKGVDARREAAGIPALVVHSFQVKNVPGRNTDAGGSEWLAQVARFELPRGSFIPPQDPIPSPARASPDFKVPGEILGKLGRRKELPAQAPLRCRYQRAARSPISMATAPASSSNDRSWVAGAALRPRQRQTQAFVRALVGCQPSWRGQARALTAPVTSCENP